MFISDVRKWMLAYCFLINDSVLEAILVVAREHLSSVSVECMRLSGETIATLCLVGVLLSFDQNFKMDKNTAYLCKKVLYQSYKLNYLRKFLSVGVMKTVVPADTTSNLYCSNSFKYDISQRLINRSQRVQN